MVIGIIGIIPAVAVVSAVSRAVKKLPTNDRNLPVRKSIKRSKSVRKKGGKYEGLNW